MSLLSTFRPKVEVLSREFIDRIIDEAFEVNATLGLQFENPQALAILADHGQKIDRAKERVWLSRDFVEKAIASAPKSFALWNVSGDKSIEVGGQNVTYDPGSAAIKVLLTDGTTRASSSADYIRLSRLVHHLPHIRANSTSLVPNDVPIEAGDYYRLYMAVQTCDKPVITGLFREESFPAMLEILKAVRGSSKNLAEKPLAIFDACPSSPLRWSVLTSHSIIEAARHGIPSEIISVPLTGATGPVTLSGTLVVHTAENLAGIALAQAVKPGAPVVYGGAPCLMDMRGGQTPFGSIETYLIDCAYAQIGKSFGFPIHSYMGLSDSKRVDAQAGYESGIGVVLAALAGVNIVSGVGILDYITCQSLEKLVIDNEICGMAYRLIDGIRHRHEKMALDLLPEAIEKGHFLGHPTTIKLFREEGTLPGKVVDRSSAIPGGGGPTDYERAQGIVRELLAKERFRLPETTVRELDRLVLKEAAEFGMEKLPVFPD
ncbi:MAG TPA: trimethylamine methyltransferase family protein [Candidatus Polarisedimenticolia bacterium]|nr:trimethylamine methyltransferase family protein [Candidatus Polarisedimenticolia bacterium]